MDCVLAGPRFRLSVLTLGLDPQVGAGLAPLLAKTEPGREAGVQAGACGGGTHPCCVCIGGAPEGQAGEDHLRV